MTRTNVSQLLEMYDFSGRVSLVSKRIILEYAGLIGCGRNSCFFIVFS